MTSRTPSTRIAMSLARKAGVMTLTKHHAYVCKDHGEITTKPGVHLFFKHPTFYLQAQELEAQ